MLHHVPLKPATSNRPPLLSFWECHYGGVRLTSPLTVLSCLSYIALSVLALLTFSMQSEFSFLLPPTLLNPETGALLALQHWSILLTLASASPLLFQCPSTLGELEAESSHHYRFYCFQIQFNLDTHLCRILTLFLGQLKTTARRKGFAMTCKLVNTLVSHHPFPLISLFSYFLFKIYVSFYIQPLFLSLPLLSASHFLLVPYSHLLLSGGKAFLGSQQGLAS